MTTISDDQLAAVTGGIDWNKFRTDLQDRVTKQLGDMKLPTMPTVPTAPTTPTPEERYRNRHCFDPADRYYPGNHNDP